MKHGEPEAPGLVTIRRLDAVAVLRLNRPPVNALSPELAGALLSALEEALADPGVQALVLAAEGRSFSAGADIHGFSRPGGDPHALTARLESSPKPVVAALHGDVLGAGLELALGCQARVAQADARLGLPEITLGLLPSAGGTQRLPRLVGPQAALALMLSGRPVAPDQALAAGLVDVVTQDPPVPQACRLALQMAQGAWRRPTRQASTWTLAPALRRLPEPAASAIQACVAAASELSLAEGLSLESRWFAQCLRSPEAAALQHAFIAERRARRVPGVPRDMAARPVHRATVIGAGTMGHGIAICLADAGIQVDLIDPDPDARQRALQAIHAHQRNASAKGRISAEEAALRVQRVRTQADLSCAAEADLVVEAVFENMALKREVFERLDRLCRSGALLATNTSSLNIDLIASATRRPQDVLGLHFFSPAPSMQLLELVRGAHTSVQALADGMALARRMNKVPVVARVGPGFIGNRMVGPYGRQAERLLLEGASPQQVDRALVNFGFPMGPHAVGDLVGLDVGVRAAAEAPASADPRDGAIARRLVAEGRLGCKTSAGLYRYEPGSRQPVPDPAVQALIGHEARRLGMTRREISDEEIVERCLLALINEGAALLAEGVALRAGDIDTVWLHGYGFPRWKGGPMHHADTLGLPQVLARLELWARRCPDDRALWQPAPLLASLAHRGRRFADLAADQQAA
ncbi:MAG: 3-hydroxyacyl-CoA dehydrogenase NAD-binding domain-containing protein [Rubrivivax sp.]